MYNFEKISRFDLNKKFNFRKFLIKKKFLNTLSETDLFYLFNENDFNKKWDYLLKHNLEHLYNILVTLYIFENFFELKIEYSYFEKKIYIYDEIYNRYLMFQTLNLILQDRFNDMIKTELDIIGKTDIWLAFSLDSLYFLKLNHYDFTKILQKKKNPLLYEKILNINLIVSTLERLDNVWFYSKMNKNPNYPLELIQNINFTKGYLICFSPIITPFLKKYKYFRKIIKKNPTVIEILKNNLTFLESIDNSNYSSPIWLKEKNINFVELEKYNIYNKALLTDFNDNMFLSVKILNFLNSIELSYDKKSFNIITNIISNNTNIDKTLSNKNSLEGLILKINNLDSSEFTEITGSLSTIIQSAAIFELIKSQINYYKSFFLDHRLDHRLRIYCYPWPINYQLNHLVRCSINFKNFSNVEEIWEKFKNHSSIVKYLKSFEIFEYKKDCLIKNLVDNFFLENNITTNNITEDLKKEFFYQSLIKISIKNNVIDVFCYLKNFMSDNIEKNWKYWIEKLKLKKKKLPYLISYHRYLNNIVNNNFNDIFWADASSNAIQLISLRLNIKNDLLMQLTNIYDNKTSYSNVYDYMCEKIKEKDHSIIINSLKNKISCEELNFLQDIDLNKYLLMPTAYGMGKFSYRNNINTMVSDDGRLEIWNKLNKNEKNLISDYFWNCASEILEEIGFPIDLYKKLCNNFWQDAKYDAFVWKNDLGIIIAPISFKISNRNEILKKIEILKMKKKEILDEKILLINQEKTDFLKKKLKFDESFFWKRTLVKSNKNEIFVRFYYKEKEELDSHLTRQSLIPNTIHSYDTSVMHLTVKMCQEIGIQVLVIHDSIGCEGVNLSLVKILFKIANIILIDENSEKLVFPLNKIYTLDKKEKELMFEKIIQSKNFFR